MEQDTEQDTAQVADSDGASVSAPEPGPENEDTTQDVPEHGHVYGFMGVCEVEGCQRLQPAWLTDDGLGTAPRRTRTGHGLGAFSGLPTQVKVALMLAATVAGLSMLAGQIAPKIGGSPDDPPPPPNVVNVP